MSSVHDLVVNLGKYPGKKISELITIDKPYAKLLAQSLPGKIGEALRAALKSAPTEELPSLEWRREQVKMGVDKVKEVFPDAIQTRVWYQSEVG